MTFGFLAQSHVRMGHLGKMNILFLLLWWIGSSFTKRHKPMHSLKKAMPVIVVSLSVLVNGCTTSSHIMTGTTRSPILVSAVHVYSAPPKNYEEVAILTVESSGWTTQGEKDQAVLKLKQEAASLGANGILLTGVGSASSGMIGSVNPATGTFFAGESNYTTMQARAIFVREE